MITLRWTTPFDVTDADDLGLIDEIAGEIYSGVIEVWPVLSGASRDAWEIESTADGIELTNGLDYIEHVQGGWSLATVEFLFNDYTSELENELGAEETDKETSYLDLAKSAVLEEIGPEVPESVKRGFDVATLQDILESDAFLALKGVQL